MTLSAINEAGFEVEALKDAGMGKNEDESEVTKDRGRKKKKRTALPSGSRFWSNGCGTIAYIKSPSSSLNHKQRKGLLYTSKP